MFGRLFGRPKQEPTTISTLEKLNEPFEGSMEGESVLDVIFEDAEGHSLLSDIDGCTESSKDQMAGSEHATSSHGVEEGEVIQKLAKYPGGLDNELDAAVANAKNSVKSARCAVAGRSKQGSRSKCSGRRKRSKDKREKFIKFTARHLGEPKVFLLKELVKEIGTNAVDDLVKKVETIEKSGGQLTADGKRRRTPGGVLWNLLRSLKPEVYRDVMNKGKQIEKQQKVNSKRKCISMDGREPKRRRMNLLDTSAGPSDPKSNEARGPFENSSSFYKVNKFGEYENIKSDHDSLYKSSYVQEAWVDGLKKSKGSSMLVDVGAEHAILGEEAVRIEKTRVPVGYDDL